MSLKLCVVVALVCVGFAYGDGGFCEKPKCDGVVYGDYCYKLLYGVGTGRDRAAAISLCQFRGGVLAEISSEYQYNLFYNYVQKNWNTYLGGNAQFVNVWTGSELTNGGIILGDGNLWRPRTQLWHNGFPNNNANHNYIGFQVNLNPARNLRGFFNTPSSLLHQVVPFCRFPLEK